ncbi:hypothetical protein ACTFIW_006350 [Dictyostelium discoideum]
MENQKQSESNNIDNNNNSSSPSSPVFQTIFENLPSDVKERKQYIYQIKKALKDEKRKLKESKPEKYAKHCKREKHESHHFHGHHHLHPEHQFGGHYFGGHHHHGGHHHGGHHGGHHHGHHHGGHHGHHFEGRHGHSQDIQGCSTPNKINLLNKKKQVLIAKTQLLEAKIATLSEINQNKTSTPPPTSIESVVGTFSQIGRYSYHFSQHFVGHFSHLIHHNHHHIHHSNSNDIQISDIQNKIIHLNRKKHHHHQQLNPSKIFN